MSVVGDVFGHTAISHGDHVLAAFEHEADQQEALSALVQSGLAAGEQVWYFTDANPPRAVVDFLERGGVAVGDHLAAGHLVVRPAAETWPTTSVFEPARVIDWLDSTVDRALARGYAGVRLTGEMSWVARQTTRTDVLVEYERRVQDVLATRPAVAICQYDLRYFAPRDTAAITPLHSHSLQFEPRAALRVDLLSEPVGLKLDGEVDLFNRGELREALSALPDDAPEVHLLLSRLRFIDVAAAGELARFARSHERCRVVLHDPPRLLRKMIDLLWPDLDLRVAQ